MLPQFSESKILSGKFIIWITFIFIYYSAQAKGIERSDLVIGDTIKFSSKILNEERTLNIYLPASYDQTPQKKYPVIYLLDGSIGEDFIHIAGLVQFGSYPWINMLPETILVGVGNLDRKRDFTSPAKDARDRKEFPSSGGSSKFIESIANEIKPLVREHYRLNGETTIIGQSLGGLLATEVLVRQGNLFDNYIIISPSLWWDKKSLLNDIPEGCCSAKSVYVGVGKEGPQMENLARTLYGKLKKNNNKKIYFGYFEKLNHGDTLHLAVYDAFSKVLGEDAPKRKP